MQRAIYGLLEQTGDRFKLYPKPTDARRILEFQLDDGVQLVHKIEVQRIQLMPFVGDPVIDA